MSFVGSMEATELGEAAALLSKLRLCSRRVADRNVDEEQRATLQRLIQLSRAPEVRALLATRDAVPTLLSLVTQNRESSFLLLKLLRNLCAIDPSNQEAFLRSFGAQSVAHVVDKALDLLKEKHGDMISILQVCLQLLGNCCGGGERQKEAVWMAFFPRRFRALAELKGEGKVAEPLCMVLYTCSSGDAGRSKDLCHGEGAFLLLSCLEAGLLCNGAGDWICLLISDLCLRQPFLPHLFSSVRIVPKDWTEEPFYSDEQAFLLGCLLDILEEKARAPGTTIGQDDGICLCGLISFLAETLQAAASGFTTLGVRMVQSGVSTPEPLDAVRSSTNPAVDVLRHILELLKVLSGSEHCCAAHHRSSMISELLSQNVIFICLELLEGLGPPDLIYKAMQRADAGKVGRRPRDNDWEGCADESTREVVGLDEHRAEGRSEVTRAALLYEGYRRDLVAVLGNAAYQNRAVQDAIRNAGGLYLILQQCVVDERNPFLREWGLWAVRNLVDGNMENRAEIGQLQMRGSVTPVELSEMGYKVEMDPAMGRPKLVNIFYGGNQ